MFDWLKEYGKHWEPGTTAFWLDPDCEADLVAWFRCHRPDFRGWVEAAGMKVEITDPPIAHSILNGLACRGMQNSAYGYLALQQAQNYQYGLSANYRPQSLFGNLFGY